MRKKPIAKSSLSSARAALPAQSAATRLGTEREDEARAVEQHEGLLVIMELGGEWPSLASSAAARRVLTQAEGEAPNAFCERVASSFDGLFGRGVRLGTVLLACNERLDEAAESARRKTLSLALGSMAQHKAGRVYLAASARSGGRLRHALSALAQGLFDEWRTAGLEVSVDFGAQNAAEASAKPFTARVA